MLERLWLCEEPPKQEAVHDYLDTYQRLPNGHYSVTLPRKDPPVELGESRPLALKRYLANERLLRCNNKLKPFEAALREYVELDHAELPQQDLQLPPAKHYYLPTHGVVKEASTTTKLRVVFDASVKTSSGASLNDSLLPTPSLYLLLTTVLTKFRIHKFALTLDISKMFREVLLDETEHDHHRFLLRSPSTGEISDYRMKRLTFGVFASPYLATQILRQAAIDHDDQHSQAARVIRETFYVDDCLTGTNTTEETIHLQQDLVELLKKAGMTLRKWRTNSPEVLATIPEELTQIKAKKTW